MLPDIKTVKGIHPGLILERELKNRNIKKSTLARDLKISSGIITDITKQRRGINASLSIRLGRYLHTEEAYFSLLQTYYQLKKEQSKQRKKVDIQLRPALFWDIDLDQLDFERHKRQIIIRVFERGNKNEVHQIINLYGKETVSEIIKNASSLLYNAIYNAKQYLSITEPELKCKRDSIYKPYLSI